MHTLDLHQHHHTLSPQGQSQQKRPPTVEERRMWRGSQYWLAGAGAAVGAYVLFSGHYVDLSVLDVDEEAEGECLGQVCWPVTALCALVLFSGRYAVLSGC